MNSNQLRRIWKKTDGHCHFCGDPIDLNKRGWSDRVGYWEVDHVIQRGKGGTKSASNCLPACTRCNRLRWHRTGKELREILWLGLIARREIKRGSQLGKHLFYLNKQRKSNNKARRTAKVTQATA